LRSTTTASSGQLARRLAVRSRILALIEAMAHPAHGLGQPRDAFGYLGGGESSRPGRECRGERRWLRVQRDPVNWDNPEPARPLFIELTPQTHAGSTKRNKGVGFATPVGVGGQQAGGASSGTTSQRTCIKDQGLAQTGPNSESGGGQANHPSTNDQDVGAFVGDVRPGGLQRPDVNGLKLTSPDGVAIHASESWRV
jgi:hypothetical protein